MPVEVRVPIQEEFEALGDLWVEFMTEQNERFVDRIHANDTNRARFLQFVNEKAGHGNVIVAADAGEGGDELIGYIVFDTVPVVMELKYLEAAILDIYVRDEYRGTGVGKMLMDKALEDIRQTGFAHVRLQVYANNEYAAEFYERLGFKRYIDILKLDL